MNHKIYAKKWEGQNKTYKKWHWKPTDFKHIDMFITPAVSLGAKLPRSVVLLRSYLDSLARLQSSVAPVRDWLHHVKSSEACFHFAKVFTTPGYPRLSIYNHPKSMGFSKNKAQRTPKLVVVWPSQYGNVHFYKQNNWRILSEHFLQTSLPPTPLRHFSWVLGHANLKPFLYTLSVPLRGPVSTLAKSWFH